MFPWDVIPRKRGISPFSDSKHFSIFSLTKKVILRDGFDVIGHWKVQTFSMMHTVRLPFSSSYRISPSYFLVAKMMLLIPLPLDWSMLFSITRSALQGLLQTITVLSATVRIFTRILPWEPDALQPFKTFSRILERMATKSISATGDVSEISAEIENGMPFFCAV